MGGGCFFTGAIPDCLEAQESDWKITYIVPRSPFIKYQFPNESIVEVIGGTNYQIESKQGSILALGNNWVAYGNTKVPGLIKKEFGTITPLYNCQVVPGWKYNGEQGYEKKWVVDPPSSDPFFNFAAGFLGGCTDSLSNFPFYNLKIFDCKGNLILQIKNKETIPSVNVFPCEYKKEDEKVIYLSPPERDVPGMKKGLVCTPTFALDGSKGTKLELVGYPIFQNTHRVTLLDLYSPQCCDKHPKICWECNADEETKDLCPPFTCFKCLNEDGQICCYGDNGTVLKIVSTKDETPDC